MVDISHKKISLRTAKAVGIIFCTEASILQIQNNTLPKGELFGVARAAGFLGAKATPQLLPHCHPVTIDGLNIEFEYLDATKHTELFSEAITSRKGIVIKGEAKSIGRTGIEMELLTAVSVAALEIYDMLKPIDKQLEIGHIKLLEKTGGKSDRAKFTQRSNTCAVLVCSDSTANNDRIDISGKLIQEMLEKANTTVVDYKIVADDIAAIQQQILDWAKADIHFIFTTGGTGLSSRDNTVEAVKALIDVEAIGIAEVMRQYGQIRTPLAMMSRGVAGAIAQTMVVTLPGSAKGAKESLEAILPAIFHAREMLENKGH